MSTPGNVPERIWDRLKTRANEEALHGREPVAEECVAHVQAVVYEVIGRRDGLPEAVIQFYAQELAERISSLILRVSEEGA